MVETSCKRHIRRCRRKQPTPLRQKSCARCARGKTRCDLRQPSCSQCREKNHECVYPSVETGELANTSEHTHTISSILKESGTSLPPVDEDGTISGGIGLTGLGGTSLVTINDSFHSTASSFGSPGIHDIPYRPQIPSSLTFSRFGVANMAIANPLLRTLPYWPYDQAESENLILASHTTFNGDEGLPKDKLSQIRDRWINPSLEPPSRTVPAQAVSAGFMTHVLKCYPKMMARDGSLPPIIHRSQSTSRTIQLVNCEAWAKIWENRTGIDEAGLLNTMQVEFDRLFIEHRLYSQLDLLAALQASLIYSIIIHLDSNTTGKFAAQLVLGQLQEMAYHLLITVAFPKTRSSGTIPNQESWIITAATHRTILAVYVFEYAICHRNRMPVYTCDELDFIPVPVGKRLWEAQEYGTWREEYENWFDMWKGRELVMGELLNGYADSSTQNRVERWLSEADEFGMLVFTGSLSKK
ncbi:hypothetical protein VTL71DRAFT_9161, partial [Oculimacula yallundae]